MSANCLGKKWSVIVTICIPFIANETEDFSCLWLLYFSFMSCVFVPCHAFLMVLLEFNFSDVF